MPAGDRALAGSADAVRTAAGWLGSRALAPEVQDVLQEAVNRLDHFADAALSVERLLQSIQLAALPLTLLSVADQAWSRAVDRYGRQLEELQERTRRLRGLVPT